MGYAFGRILGMGRGSSPTLSHLGFEMALVFGFGMMSGVVKLLSNLHSQICTEQLVSDYLESKKLLFIGI